MLNAYGWREERLAHLTDPAAEAAEAVWIDLLAPSPEEVAAVEAAVGFEVPTRDEMRDVEPSARLYTEDAAEFMIATALARLDSDDPVKSPVTFVLKGRQLVTIRYVEPRAFSIFAGRAGHRPGEPLDTGEAVMFGLVEAMIDRLADALERAGDEIDGISRIIFRKRSGDRVQSQDLQVLIEQIGRKGDLMGMIRESLSSLQRVLAYHAALDTGSRRAGKDAKQKLRLLQRDAAALGELTDSMSGKINFLLDATLGLINLEQNQIIKLFSVAAVALLPPTLIASVYGMNFDHMPELHRRFGYPWAIGLMFLSAALPYLYFKRKGWL
jgi:magnesium transporter